MTSQNTTVNCIRLETSNENFTWIGFFAYILYQMVGTLNETVPSTVSFSRINKRYRVPFFSIPFFSIHLRGNKAR
jgi:hypothetical protein